ncbi:MAG: transposase [Hyphomicrobium sp.]|uniref:RNA-guided endonuclease InsQ/TnpB family protein n=1 Tax=Hyphomicrobium sp. TaxID=82 RepID=UPI003567F4A7
MIFKLAPTAEQETLFRQFSGVCRVVYNASLYQREHFWRQFKRETGHSLNYAVQARELTKLRAEFDWIAAVSQTCEQQAIQDLDKAFANFFAGRASYPTPRRKGEHESFRFHGREIGVERLNRCWSQVRLPKIGWVRFRDTRPMRGTIKNATVRLSPMGWHVAFACEFEADMPFWLTAEVGIDRGVANSIALSTGELASVPIERLRVLDRKHRRAQQAASRRKRGSKRYAKARRHAAVYEAKAARVRKHWNHVATTTIAANYGTVCIEALKTRNMTASARGTVEEPGSRVAQKAGLNRSILEHGWFQFETFLAYKLAAAGGDLIKVDPRNTSRKCSNCGHIDARNRESQASFRCVECGHEAHADVNAARNILQAGTRPTVGTFPRRESRPAA